MSGFARRYPRELSGGQQQRVALGRSIVLEPSVLLMDEPLSNLDAKLRISIRKEITNLQRVTGVTTVYVTHDQGEALAMSDKIAVMNAGRVDPYGSPEDVVYRPSSHFVADFIGLANFIPAKVTRIDGASCELAFWRERRIETRVSDPASLRVGAAVTAMLRPEGIEVHPASTEGHASAIVQDSAMLGSGVRSWVELDGHVLTVNQVKEPGDTILLGFVTLRFKPNWELGACDAGRGGVSRGREAGRERCVARAASGYGQGASRCSCGFARRTPRWPCGGSGWPRTSSQVRSRAPSDRLGHVGLPLLLALHLRSGRRLPVPVAVAVPVAVRPALGPRSG